MLFNSLSFLVFLPVVVVVYYLIPHKTRWFWLLGASCYFYMAFVPKYILILFALIIVDYFLAIIMESETKKNRRKFYLIFGIISNIGLLFVFKYFNFFNENLSALAHLIGWNYSVDSLRLLLPLGLSFHTFQSLSYLIEVYRKNQKAERHFGIYSLFVLFFPQLVAGPIERAGHMLHQFYENHIFDLLNILNGIKFIVFGFFLKIVVADRASLVVDTFYKNPSNFGGPATVLALILFAFQLYSDFAGYTLIAIGSAKMLGLELTLNFRRPYFAKSIAEFWQRWHISLSLWFRDYVYQPIILNRKRVSVESIYIAIIITFLLSGVWHGAGWTFIFMGLFYGCLIVMGLATKKLRQKVVEAIGLAKLPRLHETIQVVITFSLVCIGWLFFRSPNVTTLWKILEKLLTGWGSFITNFYNTPYLKQNFSFGYESIELIVTFAFIFLLVVFEFLQEKNSKFIKEKIIPNLYLQCFLYTFLVLSIIIFGEFHQKIFIYFKF